MRGIRSIHERDFLLGRVRNWPNSTLQPSISGPPIILQSTHETALDVVDQTPRAGTVMTAQIEAVDFFAFDNSYARLPDRFFARLRPTPVAEPRLVRLNKKLAWHLRLDPGKLESEDLQEVGAAELMLAPEDRDDVDAWTSPGE